MTTIRIETELNSETNPYTIIIKDSNGKTLLNKKVSSFLAYGENMDEIPFTMGFGLANSIATLATMQENLAEKKFNSEDIFPDWEHVLKLRKMFL